MKKFNLTKAWDSCLPMAKWIAEEKEKHPYASVHALKRKWLKKIGQSDDAPQNNCFFCEYDFKHGGDTAVVCEFCPANIIDRTFHCTNDPFAYNENPTGFYLELCRLFRIRKKRLEKRRGTK